MNNIAQDIYVCEGLFYKLMNRIYFFFQMLLCFWVTEYCSSLPRFCPWHLICYRKWLFPLIWIFCSDSLLGGHDEWRNVPGGLCLAKWMCGHRLLGTCRYCVTWCCSGCACLWEAMLGTSLTQVWKHLDLRHFISTGWVFLTLMLGARSVPHSIFLCITKYLGDVAQF